MRRRTVAVTVSAAVVAAAGIALGVGAGPGGGGSGAAHPPAGPAASPSRSYALSQAPRTIPAVRAHTSARGPGWRPGGGRVVIGDDSLAAEGKLIAGELKLSYGGRARAGSGDVELVLNGDEPGAAGAADGPESYTLTVRDQRVRISAPTRTGVFYGTRTLKQEVSGTGSAPEGEVRDAPAKPQRGLSLDIARKMYPASWIEDLVRELGDLKLNQLGLHFSDDQAFRIQSDSHPEIVAPEHLTKAQVRSILKVADSRHVAIVPEIDSPGHLGAVIAAHPDLQLRDAQGSPARGAVDITKPAAGRIVDDLLKEYAELFRGPYWHLGGDEYAALMSPDPAASYPQLAAAARRAYGSDGTIADLATTWLNDRAKTMRPFDRTLRAWNDGFYAGTSVTPDRALQVAYWTGRENGAREPVTYLKEGRKVLNYNDEYLYYVLGQPNNFTYPTGQRIYEQWTPRVLRGTRAVAAGYDRQILGGSFAVWGDFPNAQTPDQVAAGIRMPLRATAQKLWDARKPSLSWAEFRELADRLDD